MVAELEPSSRIRTFVTNPAVIGAFAEASVRSMIARWAAPLQVCTGAVISPELCASPATVPQVDTIIWQACPAPAVFSAGDFALVPQGSVFGVLEIKRSCYARAAEDLASRLSDDRLGRLTSPICSRRAIRSQVPSRSTYPDRPGLGVICLREQGQCDRSLKPLVDDGRVVVLFDWRDSQLIPNPDAVHRLINFIAVCRYRAASVEGGALVNLGLLSDP